MRTPGKIVIWGEYAVLVGAPAAVMAVNRYAQVTLQPGGQHNRFTSQGFLTPGVYKADAQFCGAPAAAMVETILRLWGLDAYPVPFSLTSDTRAFFHSNGAKLGIGSSAAICTATYVALCDLLGRPASEAEAIAAHRQFQGGRGSGLDVAASWHGGTIRFEASHGSAWSWPSHLHWRSVWTGSSAATPGSVSTFDRWREQHSTRGEPAVLSELAQLCNTLFANTDLANLQAYCDALMALDRSAGLNIYTPEHRRLATIAAGYGLIYKPCGAGGGDIGLAVGTEPEALDRFSAAAADDSFTPLNLEIASHGVQAG